jgi:hypothetical protein
LASVEARVIGGAAPASRVGVSGGVSSTAINSRRTARRTRRVAPRKHDHRCDSS